MKAKMSYKSKRIAIIAAVIVVLIAAISVGTYFFIQGNDDSQAAYTGNEQDLAGTNNGESQTETPTTPDNSGNQTNPVDEQNNENETNQEGEDSQEPTNADDNTDNDTTGTQNEGTDANNNGGNDSEVPNEEYTQTDIIETEVERVEQEVRVGWSNIGLASAQISTDITTNKPQLSINKTAKLLNALNQNDNAVQEGSEITYEITVTNHSENIDATNVNISDVVPAGTKLKENSVSNIESATIENGRISWVVDVARNSSVTVSFTVVVENTENEILNTAVVDGKETPEVANPVIETEKTIVTEEGKTTEYREGSEVTYVIKITNTGTSEAITTVSDPVPAGTTLKEDSITSVEDANYTVADSEGQKVITWNNVKVPAGKTVELNFTVTINEFEGESIQITNTAVVGDTDTNPEDITAYNPILGIEKDAQIVGNKTVAKEGDRITYTITVGNTGRVDGTATIKDSIPQGTSFVAGSIKVNGNSSYVINGETVDLTDKTDADLANGILVNVPARTDESTPGEVTISFQVDVTEIDGLTGPISNVAHLVDDDGNDVPTDPTETDIEAHIVFVENGGSGVADMDGVAGQEITDRNMPVTTRPGYTFEGWYTDDQTFTNKVEQLPETMVAGTTTYYAKWTANTNTPYTVEFYYEENGEYKTAPDIKDETRTGTTDTTAYVTEQDKVPDPEKGNYIFDADAANVLEGTITGDGKLVLKVYFKEQFTVTYEPGDHGTFEAQTNPGLDYGDATPAFEGEKTGDAGYTFTGWAPAVAENVTGNATYVAQWKADEDTAYTVEFYYEKDGAYSETPDATDPRTGTTDEAAYVTEQDKVPDSEKGNYVFDADAANVLSGTITGDGELVLKVYFKEQFTVTYEPGDHGTFEAQNHTADYGDATPAFDGETTGDAGYTFTGWAPAVAENVTENATYVAQWKANDNTPYKVEFYYEVNGNYSTTPDDTDPRTGTTDTTANVTVEDKTPTRDGYVYDNEAVGKVESGTITGDGNLTLKVYFKQQFTVTYNPGTHGTFEAEEYTAGYGDTTPEFKGTTTGQNGFYFVDWDKDVEATVTGNVTYTALWEGLEVLKTRTEIVDLDKQNNTTFVDQAGDIIKYTITVNNIGDVKASGIVLTDDHDVTVTSVKVNGNETDISGMDNEIAAGDDLLENITTEIEPGSSVVVTVEYTVTEADIEEALAGDGKIVNTATATLNDHDYTGTDKTEGEEGTPEEGTDVKERCEYTVLYYFNGELNDDYTVESSTVEGATIAFEKPDTLDGYTYVKYVGVDGKDNGSTTAVEGENIIKVYYAKPVVSIEKTSTANVNAGDDIEYTITVSNDGDLGTTVTVEDELKGTTYVSGSSKVGDKATEPTIENKVLSWEVELAAGETKTITFKATTANDSIGDTIENTASIKGEDKKDSTTTDVNEIDVNYNEFKEGQKGTDLNIIFVLDNSSSMNYPIEGQSYRYNDNPIAPTDEYKTRIYNAKEAIKGFIDNQSNNPNTDMSVITFNQDSTGTTDTKGGIFSDAMRTLLDPNEYDIKEESYGLFGKRYYTIIDGERYDLERVTGSDGKQYYAANLPIKYGARLAGTNAESNEALKTIVDNISISSEKSGFGTYIGYAFNLINNNREQYLSATKKNIIIVLADGDFNGSYSNALKDLKEQNRFSDYNVDEIYSIGFGADYNEAKLKEVSTNNKCYSASNSSDLLEQFNKILEEATGETQSGTTTNGSITFKQATGDIKVTTDCPIEATYATGEYDGEGNEIMATLFSCTSEADLSKYGLSISRGYITWDAKVFARNNPDVKVPSEVNIKYYIARD